MNQPITPIRSTLLRTPQQLIAADLCLSFKEVFLGRSAR